MTLRGVIQGLFRGSDDAEAILAENGFADLPADIFGQALSSYADTAPMAEADALTPVLASLEAGDPSDVFAVLAERPLATSPEGSGVDPAAVGASLAGAETVDDVIDDFGVTVDAEPDTSDLDDLIDAEETALDDSGNGVDEFVEEDPFAAADFEESEPAADAESFENLFDTEPQATGDDPSDLDLDF